VPAVADPQARPEWVRISSGRTALWHDHRIHWMGSQLPPSVARAPGRTHVQAEWQIGLRQGSTALEVTGRLTWIPGRSAAPWLVASAALAIGGLTLGLRRRWSALAVAVVAVTANDLYHAGAVAWSWSGNTVYRTTQLIEGNSFSIAGWVAGLVGAWWLWRRRVDGLYAAVFAGVSAVLFTGVLDLSVLGRSEAPFTGPVALDRAMVSVSLGLGLGVVLGALAGLRAARTASGPGPEEECTVPEPPATLLGSA